MLYRNLVAMFIIKILFWIIKLLLKFGLDYDNKNNNIVQVK